MTLKEIPGNEIAKIEPQDKVAIYSLPGRVRSISSAIEIVSSMTVSTAMMRVLCKLRNQMERIPSQLRNTITVVLYLKTLERDKLFTVRQLATFVEPKQQPMLTTFTDSWVR